MTDCPCGCGDCKPGCECPGDVTPCRCDGDATGTAPAVVLVPAEGSFIVVDGVVTEDPSPAQVLAAFGCSMGCR